MRGSAGVVLVVLLAFLTACHDHEADQEKLKAEQEKLQTSEANLAKAAAGSSRAAGQQPAAPQPSQNFTPTLLGRIAAVVQADFAQQGSKMPGYGEAANPRFESLPHVDIASFGLTCNIADLNGRWKWDNENVWIPGSASDGDAWIDVTPGHISFVVNVKNNPMEDLQRQGFWHPTGTSLDAPANRTRKRGPVEIIGFDFNATQVETCKWRLSFVQHIENRAGTASFDQACFMAAEYAAMGARTLSDKDDFLWERLDFYDCFPHAETIQNRLDELGLRMAQGHNGDGFEPQHWLQMWSRKRQVSWRQR